MSEARPYTLTHDKERLIFMTSSYRAEKESVLHRGIYSRELASMLSSASITGAIYIFIAFNYSVNIFHYLALLIIFILAFIGLRETIFKEKELKVIFDKSSSTATLIWPGILFKRTETFSFDDVESVRIGSKRIIPENIDGIEFVERISRQHGSAVPGLGEEAEFVTLNLQLKDGSERLIYAQKIEGRVNGEPDIPINEIRSFLNAQEN
jgi:hypothetical protein